MEQCKGTPHRSKRPLGKYGWSRATTAERRRAIKVAHTAIISNVSPESNAEQILLLQEGLWSGGNAACGVGAKAEGGLTDDF